MILQCAEKYAQYAMDQGTGGRLPTGVIAQFVSAQVIRESQSLGKSRVEEKK
jgi:hypothetical protein